MTELINSLKNKEKIRILFVCLGNICRSCAAEEIMRKLVTEAGMTDEIQLDSAGLINYHEGELADVRMRAHAERRGYHITHLSRPVRYNDFFDFDLRLNRDPFIFLFFECFFNVISKWPQENLEKLLKFITGTSVVPVEGFRYFDKLGGKIGIQFTNSNKNSYPVSHT